MDLSINLPNLPPAKLCTTFSLLAHSKHVDLTTVACFAITTSEEQIEKLDIGLLSIGDNYTDTDYFTEDGEVNQEVFFPETMSFDYGLSLRQNVLLFFKLLTDTNYSPQLTEIYICYDVEYTNIAASLLAAYYIVKGVDAEEAIARTAVQHRNTYYDYATICFIDLILNCNNTLIEAVETYEVTDIAITRDGLVAERQ
jgi:hypothetical protein